MTATLAPPTGTSAESPGPSRIWRLLVVHVLIGGAIFVLPQFASLFAAATLVRVAVVVWASDELEDVLVAMSYAVGTEVLWRMTGARVPWEITKYVLLFGSLVTFARFKLVFRSWTPVVLAALLVPASVSVVVTESLDEAREAIVSNVLGLVAMAAVAAMCASIVSNRTALSRTLWSLVVALVPMATFMALTLATTANVTFSSESEFAASGNFGPNQVATALSLGLLAIYLLVVVLGDRNRAVLLGIGSWFLVAMLLTFSRGGLVSFAVAALLATGVMLADARRFMVTIGAALVGIVLVVGVLLPRLDSYTGGALSERYSDTDNAHRSEIADSDWEMFVDDPLIGVGPGRSPELRGEGPAQGRQSHVAYSRLLAEHGVLGIGVILCFLGLVVAAFRRAVDRRNVAWATALFAWALVTMAHADVRLAAVGFSFGLACVGFRKSPDVELADGVWKMPAGRPAESRI